MNTPSRTAAEKSLNEPENGLNHDSSGRRSGSRPWPAYTLTSATTEKTTSTTTSTLSIAYWNLAETSMPR